MNNLFITNVENLSRDSYAKVYIKCNYNVSKNCKKMIELAYKNAITTIERNDGNYICTQCARERNNDGGTNNILNKIDTSEKAYLLGCIVSNGIINKKQNSIKIIINKRDMKYIGILRNLITGESAINIYKDGSISIEIYSQQICNDIYEKLKITEKLHEMILPNLINDDLIWMFLRGFFDGNGEIQDNNNFPDCVITSSSIDMLNMIGEFSKIPYKINGNNLLYHGTNCIDFLGKVYTDTSNKLYLERKYNLYLSWINWKCRIEEKGDMNYLDTCRIYKTDKNAKLPKKHNTSDVGYDLTIIKEVKKVNDYTTLYDTGLKLYPTYGYYTEIVPRSSLSKSGYILSNSVGIIEQSYNGNLFVSLTKIDKKTPDIELPFRCCQLIFKPQIYMNIEEVAEKLNDNTTRNGGGFGSTNKK